MGEELKYISTFDVIYMIVRNCLGNSMSQPKCVMIVHRYLNSLPFFSRKKSDDNLCMLFFAKDKNVNSKSCLNLSLELLSLLDEFSIAVA